jgi:hypothetical protein
MQAGVLKRGREENTVAIVLSNDGRRGSLGYLLPWLRGLKLRLYVNNVIPLVSFVRSDFVEATFDTYAALLLNNWGAVYLNGLGDAQVDAPLKVFTVGAGGGSDTVYGYYVTDGFGYAIWGERVPGGGVPMILPGSTFPIIPRFAAGALC